MQKNEKQNQEQKELKRLLEAHTLVLANKLGRTPTLEEIQQALSDKAEKSEEAVDNPTPIALDKPNPGEPIQEVKSPGGATEPAKLEKDDREPKINNMKVYYGLGEDKKPDLHKILYYETAEGRVYCCSEEDWLEKRPTVLDHLPNRPILMEDKDLVAAIAHGVMDDEDYEDLEKNKIITELPRRLWSKMKHLKGTMDKLEELEKSAEQEEEAAPEISEEALVAEVLPQSDGANLVQEFLSTAGVDLSVPDSLSEILGENAVQMIMQTAQAAALTGMEEQIRAIVREELAALSGDSAELEQEIPMEMTEEEDLGEIPQEEQEEEGEEIIPSPLD